LRVNYQTEKKIVCEKLTRT